MKYNSLLGFLNFVLIGFSASAQSFIFSPGPGLGGHYPYLPFEGPIRLQQVYAASDFGAITTPVYLTQMSFRPMNSYTSVVSQMEINVSTTTRSPDSLSPAFLSNIGPDQTLVFNGSIPIPISPSMVGNFSLIINFQNPFLYNPAAGNLLVDFKNISGRSPNAGPNYMDGVDNSQGEPPHPADSVSSVYSPYWDANSPSGSLSSIGLVTRFTFISVPEPSSLVSLSLGSLVFGAFRYRKKLH